MVALLVKISIQISTTRVGQDGNHCQEDECVFFGSEIPFLEIYSTDEFVQWQNKTCRMLF